MLDLKFFHQNEQISQMPFSFSILPLFPNLNHYYPKQTKSRKAIYFSDFFVYDVEEQSRNLA